MSITSNGSTTSAKPQVSRLPHIPPQSDGASSLSLSRFPPELKSIILQSIASLDEPHLINIMCTSQDMYDHFGPILYNRLDINEKNAKKIFYGIIPYQIPGTTRFLPQPEEGEDVDFALIGSEKIESHRRKIWLLQQVKHLVLRDETAVQQVALGLYFSKSASIEWHRRDFELKATQAFSQLHTLVLDSPCIPALCSSWPWEKIKSHRELLKAVRHQLDARHVCILSQDTLNYLVWYQITLIPMQYSRRFRDRSLTVHQGFYDAEFIDAVESSKTAIQLKSCHCDICHKADSVQVQPSQGVCPFTVSDLVKLVCFDIERMTKMRNIKWYLELKNLPRCLFKTWWISIEGNIRVSVAKKGIAISAVRLERALAAWQRRFESWKMDDKVETCICCGQT